VKNWFRENITAVIACIILTHAGVIDVLVLLKQVRTTETNTTIILQNSNAMAMLVLGYYFVSSKRSSGTIEKAEEVNINTKTP
jgi:hypothetical protein